MTRFLLRRLAHAAFVLFGVSVLAFFFSTFAPGNYLDDMRLNPQISAEQLSALRADYQLDRPMPVRYMRWAGAVLHGDLGLSFAYNTAVGPLLWPRARNTLLLTGTATVLVWMLALPLGVWSAEKLGQPADVALSWATAVLLIIPDLALALGLLLLAVRSGWLPTGGMVSVGSDGFSAARRVRDVAWHMVLPVAVLVASALPVLLLSGSLLVEVVMSWPGLGPFLLEAILARDLYVVIGGVLLSTLFLVAGNLVADLLLYWADPRIRAEAPRR